MSSRNASVMVDLPCDGGPVRRTTGGLGREGSPRIDDNAANWSSRHG